MSGGLGGSIGRKLNSAYWTSINQAANVIEAQPTYRSAIFSPQLWPYHCHLDEVFDLRYSGKAIHGRRKCFLDVFVCVSCHLHPEARNVEVREHAIVVGAVVVERKLQTVNRVI